LSHSPIAPDADPSRRAWLACPNCDHGVGCLECESGRNCGTHWRYLLKNSGTRVSLQCPTCFYVWMVDTAEPDRHAPAVVRGDRRNHAAGDLKEGMTGDAAFTHARDSDDGESD
jgi:hypothetical protein